jgi:ABC-type nickel/cobalt efflux system permease component RcnA
MISRPMMPRVLIIVGAALGLGLLALWGLGGLDGFTAWAADSQRAAQNAMARALRALQAGQPGAWAALMGVCFAYGFFHAAGPGHGKVLIGGYGVARRVGVARLAGIALASSLAQAATAVLLVYAGVYFLNLSRQAMVGLAEDVFAPLSYAAIGLIGLWLAWRGGRSLWRARAVAGQHDAVGHTHAHGHTHTGGHTHNDGHARTDSHTHSDGHMHSEAQCGTCGHAHGPSLQDVEALTGWRDTAMLIAGIAIRPCTGALFLLILCWRMGIDSAGIAGAFAMGMGTATITVAVAGLSVWARQGALLALAGGRLSRAAPVIEVAAGVTVAFLSLVMLRAAL